MCLESEKLERIGINTLETEVAAWMPYYWRLRSKSSPQHPGHQYWHCLSHL